jgi:hypothetical protein
MTPAKTIDDRFANLEAEVTDLQAQVAALRTATAEVALAAIEDLGALAETSPLHGSAHVQQRIIRRFPVTRLLVEQYLALGDSYAARVQRTVASMQEAHAAAERGAVEGALIGRRRGSTGNESGGAPNAPEPKQRSTGWQ